MVTAADIPNTGEPIAGNGGFVTRVWVDFFLKLASEESNSELASLYAALASRVAELEDGQALNFQILGQGSISVNGIPQPGGVVIVTLQNDNAAPGNTSYYGTGPTGAKGWFPLSGAFTVTSGELTKTVGSDGVTNFGLADLANSGVGAALVKITRDSKGRMAGTSSATTDDLPQGVLNKYFPEAPINGNTYGRKDGTWVVIPASSFGPPPTDGFPYIGLNGVWERANDSGSRFWLIEYALLTDQAGNQLTDQAGNFLMTNSPTIPPGWPVAAAATPPLQILTLAQANALVNPGDFDRVAITDLAGGREICFYDTTVASGTKWRRTSDRSIAN